MTKNSFGSRSLVGGLTLAAVLAAGLGSTRLFAGTVDLGNAPPDLSSAVNPNVVVTFDDSGSMGATALPDGMADDYNNKYYYDPSQNLIYFDPMKDYPPPLRPDGSAFPDSVYTAAWRDGICQNWSPSYCFGAGITKNLSNRFYEHFGNETATTNKPNATATDNRTIPTGVRPTSGGGFWYSCPTAASNTGCVLKEVATAIDPKPAPPAPQVAVPLQQRFANWYSYYRTRNLMTRTALSRVFGGPSLDNKVRVIWQTINADFSGTPTIRSRQVQDLTGTWKTSFFNWMLEVQNNGGTPNRRAAIEAAKVFERTLTSDYMNPYWYPPLVAGGSGRSLECRQNFHMLVTDGYWNESDPALPTPYVKQNVAGTLPDGKAYAPGSALTRIYSNVAGTAYDSSMSNIAFNYWARDLQPTLANKVPAYWADRTAPVVVPPNDPGSVPDVYWNPANDPATWQHVVQYMVTLGIAGNLNFPGDYSALLAGTKTWPQPVNNSLPAVDDTWHASINSRGEYFSAKNPTELVDQMTAILGSILARRGASTSAAVSTGVLTTKTLGFTAGYDSADWSGYLLAQAIDANGNLLPTVLWDASCKLTGGSCPSISPTATVTQFPLPNGRTIITSNGTLNSGKPFRWASLNAVQQAALNSTDARGLERLDYLRGSRASETITTPPPLRKRGSLLGAVINGQPRYYGPVETSFDDLWPRTAPERTGQPFSKYKISKLSRPERVFLASNDGMLHAFDMKGTEKWAFVPNTLFTNGKLKTLTDRASGLVPTVDERPILGDAYLRGQWRSTLVGSLRFGGRGIYALDVTDAETSPTPAPESEAAATAKVMWEFNSNSAGAANLGYTYDSANVARLANGKWVVLLSSGYFPKTGPDSLLPAAIANRTSLFVIDMETGLLIRELQTPIGVTSYGLSGPEVVNYNRGVETNIDSFAVAGDLAGNLWRFNLENADPAAWSVTLMFQTYDGVAANIGKQPISVTPIAFNDRARPNRAILLFGTGKYLGDEDRLATGTPQQYLYGIRDSGASMARVTLAQLSNQTMTNEAGDLRAITRGSMTAANEGWRINLPTLGERNVVMLTPLFVRGLAIFSTIIPAGDNPCDPSRTGAVIVVNSQTGSGPDGLLDDNYASPLAGRIRAGVLTKNPPISGALGVVNVPGGPKAIIPGLLQNDGTPVSLDIIPVWRRGSWREALNFTE